MGDFTTPNLPAIDFDQTAAFYAGLGFEERYRDDGWMILVRAGMALEFFPHPDLDPAESWFSACFRVDDLDGFAAGLEANIVSAMKGEDDGSVVRWTPPKVEPSGVRIAYLIDPNGSLIRLIDNSSAPLLGVPDRAS